MRDLLNTCAAVTVLSMPRAFASAPAPTPTPAAEKPRVEPVLTAVTKAVPMPSRVSKRGSVSAYRFDDLTEVGMSFGVKNKTAAQISSIVSNANRKALVAKTDAAGNTVYKTKELTDPSTGAKTVVPTTEAEMIASKHFFAVDVDAAMAKTLKGTEAEGAKTLVFRDA